MVRAGRAKRGEARPNGNPAPTNWGPIQYTGHLWLSEIEVYYAKNRMYDPRLMRFLTTDPIGVSGGMNIYAYVGGDPVNYVDPLGLEKNCATYYHYEGSFWHDPDTGEVVGRKPGTTEQEVTVCIPGQGDPLEKAGVLGGGVGGSGSGGGGGESPSVEAGLIDSAFECAERTGLISGTISYTYHDQYGYLMDAGFYMLHPSPDYGQQQPAARRVLGNGSASRRHVELYRGAGSSDTIGVSVTNGPGDQFRFSSYSFSAWEMALFVVGHEAIGHVERGYDGSARGEALSNEAGLELINACRGG
jgi:RHS repeat-associated protein